MKYIRTKDRVVELKKITINDKLTDDYIHEKVADTIEELCDCYSYGTETTRDINVAKGWNINDRRIYGCILTDKGLIYVAKMNEKGELELL